MSIVKGLKYSQDHEWVRVEGSRAYVGITDHAQEALGSIVFVELPKKGTKVEAHSVLSVIESVKAASDVYSPVGGTVVEVNELLSDEPGKINEDPYGSWIASLELADPSDLESLMDADEYGKYEKGE